MNEKKKLTPATPEVTIPTPEEVKPDAFRKAIDYEHTEKILQLKHVKQYFRFKGGDIPRVLHDEAELRGLWRGGLRRFRQEGPGPGPAVPLRGSVRRGIPERPLAAGGRQLLPFPMPRR